MKLIYITNRNSSNELLFSVEYMFLIYNEIKQLQQYTHAQQEQEQGEIFNLL